MLESLEKIKEAMDQIKDIDRSDYFNNYYNEVVERILLEKLLENWRKNHIIK